MSNHYKLGQYKMNKQILIYLINYEFKLACGKIKFG